MVSALWRSIRPPTGHTNIQAGRRPASLSAAGSADHWRIVGRTSGSEAPRDRSFMTHYVFVDESKARGYLLVATFIDSSDLPGARRRMSDLVLKGQRRVHMRKESNSRRRGIADVILDLPSRTVVFEAGRQHAGELKAREACLRALSAEAVARHTSMVVLEEDASLRRWDNQRLVEITRAAGCRDSLRYEHRRAAVEPLLTIPDGIAWCWARGGHWRARVAPAVAAVREV